MKNIIVHFLLFQGKNIKGRKIKIIIPNLRPIKNMIAVSTIFDDIGIVNNLLNQFIRYTESI